jgi:hypothetical protein
MSARWVVTEDADMIGLRVDLWNGYAVHLVAWKDDTSPPFVALREGQDGERDLAAQSFGSFKAWLDRAQGRGQPRGGTR